MGLGVGVKGMKCKHIKEPTGYIEWHNWAEKKSRTHRQIRCEKCGLYKIWLKNE